MSDVHCFYVSAGLLAPKHVERIGGSIWEFLWLISHETKMGGKVLNGSPITVSRIAGELGESLRTAKRNLSKLCRAGYVARNRAADGKTYCYAIAHSRKWRIHWDSANSGDKNVTSDKNGTYIGDKNVPTQGTKMAPESAIRIKVVDKVDSKHTTCTNCKGTGLVLRMVPSDLIPGTDKYDWVKCDECQRS